MRALSIRQPWAWLIIRPDLNPAERAAALAAGLLKPIENRDWPTGYRGPLLVHAGKSMLHKDHAAAIAGLRDTFGELAPPVPPMDALDRGGIVGRVDLVDCVRTSASPWFIGEFGFVLANAAPLPFSPCAGKLGFFHVPEWALRSPAAGQ